MLHKVQVSGGAGGSAGGPGSSPSRCRPRIRISSPAQAARRRPTDAVSSAQRRPSRSRAPPTRSSLDRSRCPWRSSTRRRQPPAPPPAGAQRRFRTHRPE